MAFGDLVRSTALQSGTVTKNSDTTWTKDTNNERAGKRKERQKWAYSALAKVVDLPQGNTKQFIC